MKCADPFIIVGTDDNITGVESTEILSRTFNGAVTEVNNYSHILVPEAPWYFPLSDNASTQPALNTMVNETFLLTLPPELKVKVSSVFKSSF